MQFWKIQIYCSSDYGQIFVISVLGEGLKLLTIFTEEKSPLVFF